MIKSLVVAVDGSENAQSALRYALWLAQRFDAVVTGLHVADVVTIEGSFFHDISGSLGFEPYLDLTSKMRGALRDRGEQVLEDFSRACREADIRHETSLQVGIVSAEICELARTSDLVVLGKRGVNRHFSTGLLGGVTESVARQCPRPIFMAPLEFVEPGKALLAYDGSQRAGSAMHVAAEVCTLLELPLDVVTVSLEEDRGEEIADEARRYLASYPITTEVRVVEGHAYEAIPAEVEQWGYDLLFMGSHGHGRVLEFVLGSTTEFVLRNVTCPVFLNR